MKKTYFFLTALLVLLSQFVFAGTNRSWELLSSEDGIEFYVSNIEVGGGRTKTLLKIQNTNEHESKVSFYAIFPCSESQTKKQAEIVFVGANETAIYTYQVCEIGKGKKIELKSIQVIEQ